jgi:hypothetical protein
MRASSGADYPATDEASQQGGHNVNNRQAAMRAHCELVRAGEYCAARLVLRGLLRGRVVLGLGNDAWAAESTTRAHGVRYATDCQTGHVNARAER